MTRIGAVYSGTKWQLDLFKSDKYGRFIDDIIHACQLPEMDISALDVIVVPRESNQEKLLEAKEKLIEFLNDGKTLIAFGEVTRPWLPCCIWKDTYPEFAYKADGTKECLWDKGQLVTRPYRILESGHPLFQNLTIEDLQWHFHGMFQAPPTAEVLLRYGEDGDIIYLDTKRFKGKILATTLDPEVHAGYGVVKKTQKFLDNVFKWAVREGA